MEDPTEVEDLRERLLRAEELLKRLVANSPTPKNCQCGLCEAKRFLDEVV